MSRGVSRPVDESMEAAKAQRARKKKKSGKPQGNSGDKFVTGLEKFSGAGKGDKYRPIEGWHSPEMTEKLRKIFKKNGKKKKAKS